MKKSVTMCLCLLLLGCAGTESMRQTARYQFKIDGTSVDATDEAATGLETSIMMLTDIETVRMQVGPGKFTVEVVAERPGPAQLRAELEELFERTASELTYSEVPM